MANPIRVQAQVPRRLSRWLNEKRQQAHRSPLRQASIPSLTASESSPISMPISTTTCSTVGFPRGVPGATTARSGSGSLSSGRMMGICTSSRRSAAREAKTSSRSCGTTWCGRPVAASHRPPEQFDLGIVREDTRLDHAIVGVNCRVVTMRGSQHARCGGHAFSRLSAPVRRPGRH